MNWKDYELQIFEYFKSQYPNTTISHNVTVMGRYSKVARQIDILIEANIAGMDMKIIIDGKYFSKKIDVKQVESFIAMVHDCEAHKGLLITHCGYTKAAMNRAFHDPYDIELDILNFKDLHEFQGFKSIPYRDGEGVLLAAPFGWVCDLRNYNYFDAILHQRGLTLEQAQKLGEWMYIKIRMVGSEVLDLKDLIAKQNTEIKNNSTGAHVKMIKTINRQDAEVQVRVISYSDDTEIYTGFIGFKNFIFECNAFTPLTLHKKNLRKLETVLEQVIPIYTIVEMFKWDVETFQKGHLLVSDVPYMVANTDRQEYITITVGINKLAKQPEFISIILPDSDLPETGVTLKFASTLKNSKGEFEVHLNDDQELFLPFLEHRDNTRVARILNGIVNPNTKNEFNVFQAMLAFDHLHFSFVYSNSVVQQLRVPMFSLKRECKKFSL